MSNGRPMSVMFTAVTGVQDVALRDGADQSLDALQRVTARLRALAEAQGGEVVDSVGEELLIVFGDADGALATAQQMQLDVHLDPAVADPAISLAIGLHHGAVSRRGDDVYGDAVNTAARVKSQSTARRILVSAQLRDELNPFLARFLSPFDRIEVKGKARPLELFEVPWESGDMNRTEAMPAVSMDSTLIQDVSTDGLLLEVDGKEHRLAPRDFPVSLGRGHHCDLPVASQSASRLHCRIEYRRGKFVLMDSSTNGTWLERSDGSRVHLKREAAVLTGSGRISLGETPEQNPSPVRFECIS